MDYRYIKGLTTTHGAGLQRSGLGTSFIGKPLNFKPDFKEASVEVVNRTFLKADMP